MNLFESNDDRLAFELERLRRGEPMRFDNMEFCFDSEGKLRVSMPSSWELSNLSEPRARRDFERANRAVEFLIKESPAFATMVKSRPRYFCLTENLGNSIYEIARLEGDVFSSPFNLSH
jgi:hypothetical protein